MEKKIFTRRELFTRYINKDGSVSALFDPLFEKYSRKVFSGRVYQKPELVNDTNTGPHSSERTGPVTSGLNPYSGTWTETEALHLLRRTNFGFKKADVDALAAMTLSNAVDAILAIDPIPPTPPVNWYTSVYPDTNGLPYGADWTNDPLANTDSGRKTNKNRHDGLKRWLLGLGLNQDATIREKMVWFWYHFIPVDFQTIVDSTTQYASSNSARICYQYIKMFRDGAIGNFKTLIRTMATQPAMMIYLNNQENTNTAPDENFAREVMELFTLGKDPASQYTQSDVVQAAKLLTGWRIQNLNAATTSTAFTASYHETSNKQFSSFFNNTLINNLGVTELDAFFDMIFSKDTVVSQYICRRLYRYFVYYDIDANIEANVIVPLAQTFVANNWNILPVLKQLLNSDHFFDMANRGVYIKSPFDLVIGSLRTFNINTNVSDASNYQAQYQLWQYFNDNVLDAMDQVMGKVPSVSGWSAFYQMPSFHEYWINSNTTQRRFAFLQRLFNGFDLTNNNLTTHIQVDVIAFVTQFSNTVCMDPDLLVAACVAYLLPIDLSITNKNTLKIQTLLSGQVTNNYWTTAWNSYINNPSDAVNLGIVKTRLKSLLTTITQYAEFQLM